MFGESNYNKAVNLYKSAEYQEAIPKFIKALESGDLSEANIYNSFVYLGACCIEIGNYNSAIVNLKKALEWDAKFYWAYFEFGMVYYNKEEYELALDYFNKSINGLETHLHSWYYKGLTLEKLRDYDSAIKTLKNALKISVSENSGETNEIKRAINRVTNLKYGCIHSEQLEKIEQLQENKDYDSAIFLCKEMLESGNLNKEHLFAVHCKLGECYSNIKQNQTAISEFKTACNIAPNIDDCLLPVWGLVMIYLANCQYNEVIERVNQYVNLLEKDQSRPSRRIKFSEGQRIQIRDDKFKRVKAKREKRIRVLRLFSKLVLLIRDKKYEELLSLCTKEEEIDSYAEILTILHISIGLCLQKLGRYDELLTQMSSHINDGDDNGMYASYVGIAHFHNGHYETALQYLERGINEGNDGGSDTWGYKGECHFVLGEYDKSIEAYQKAIEVQIPNDDNDFEIPYLEEKIRVARQKHTQEKSKIIPSHITIQGNSAPINFGGIIATDDAVINRSNVADSSDTNIVSNFCPQCGAKVEAGDMFCRKCGRKLV